MTAATIRRSRVGAPHAPAMIRDRVPFRASALTGTDAAPLGSGELPEPFASDYYGAGVSGSLRFVVLSYSTPIAWLLESGEWIVPNVRYGRTTTGHQSAVRVALHGERVTQYPADRVDAPSYESRKPYRRPRSR